jgi:hypothetical protein
MAFANGQVGKKGLKIAYQLFFDRELVLRRIGRKKAKALGRSGAFSRGVIRKKIRKAPKRARKPSKYPRYHGSPRSGLRFVLFHFDPKADSVVIGPPLFQRGKSHIIRSRGRVVGRQTVKATKTVPQLLNEGGRQAIITELFNDGKRLQATATYRQMPFRDDSIEPSVQFFKEQISALPL